MREHSGEFLYLRWVWADEGIDPYEFFRGFRKNRGIVTGGNPRRGRTSAFSMVLGYLKGIVTGGNSWKGPHQCELH